MTQDQTYQAFPYMPRTWETQIHDAPRDGDNVDACGGRSRRKRREGELKAAAKAIAAGSPTFTGRDGTVFVRHLRTGRPIALPKNSGN